MNTLRLLLLEDLDKEANALISFLETNDYEVVRVANAEEAEKEIKNRFFDVIILDIMIDGRPEGIELAQRLNQRDMNVPFLFLTSMQSKTVFDEAKLTNPMVYLLKPYNELELLYSLELAIESCYQQSNSISFNEQNAVLSPSFLFIKKKRSVVKVDVSSINYIEVKEKYCSLLCDEGNYLIKLSLTKLKEMLSNPDFKQVHRNYLVNIKKIKEIYFEDNLIILQNKGQIPFSERYKNAFIKDNTIFR
ncbi:MULTISPECIES: LytR/AlgR family response regulator transcription factor [Tenacibaculum]|uniref:LytR/AlgR family response regulator transcription factor n=1 Tax=Tenacibaculum TaxID=104267 RepID=UPI00089991FA|nr:MULTISPECIES: LytTR family DNA-binding domain-containing protein [unclassified Tenacibaculum]RBW56699.1 DNA-binding response regulator [Tenacibaculum sp. E3R01]SEE55479.1 DNA-binding response regulator, LytR/AlgR family [Tenacibaculum sp. MAR_2010_89]